MYVCINSAVVLLTLLSWNMCAVAAATEIVLGPGATVFLENCLCSGDKCVKEPEPTGLTVNCTTLRGGLTLTRCGGGQGSSPAECTAVTVNSKASLLSGCNFSSDVSGSSEPCCPPLSTTQLISNNENGEGKIKLTPTNKNNPVLLCSSIRGENQTTNEPPEQGEQNGDTPRAPSSSNAVASALKSPHDTDTVVSKPTQNSSNSTPHVPKTNKPDESSEKLSAANSTTTSTKNDAQSEGRELCAMEVAFKCAAASLFIFSAFF
ncbi:hypothetical protein TRVL_09471 [Trypanosoma vivax]|uniref:Uncharacterized protein n=1 Tax=Trypanosoma vivax (strain Y486) TaxID=1055687 RepID=F9WM10_TRYVY|nr:hypothetical protein TRVL_09471 [Trypanosoma vivax]CCD18560.1 hypothetical protein, conserved in T. vivax [Trypanosoma vivax Y486]|eukprot:CCD18560.1 hypothetical protein, conserved in T. vivax [Trypanosoma vivax Y486]